MQKPPQRPDRETRSYAATNPENPAIKSRGSMKRTLMGSGSATTIKVPLVEDPTIETGTLKPSEILDGASLNSLTEDIRGYETASGDIIYAATDKGIGYKDLNEDRAVVSPKENMTTVIDGMGGHKNGDKAAQFVAEAFLKYPNNPERAAVYAVSLIKLSGIDKDAGACVAYARICSKDRKKYEGGQKYVDVASAGDVKALIFKGYKLAWESKDDTLVQSLVDAKVLEPGGEFYFPDTDTVLKFLSYKKSEIKILELKDLIPVNKGDLVMLMSDGFGANITPKETEDRIQGLTPREIIQTLADISGARMANAQKTLKQTDALGGRSGCETYSDGFLSAPKPDNRGIGIIEIN